MVVHWNSSDSAYRQVCRTLSILAGFNNAVVWMVSSWPLISKSSSPFKNPMEIVPSAPPTIDIIGKFLFYSLISSLARFRYLSLFFPSFNFTLWSARSAMSIIRQVPFFGLLSLGLVVWLRLSDPFTPQNPREFYASHYLGRIAGCVNTICLYDQI